MSSGAIVMLIISIVVVWGGLIAAVINFRRHPEPGGDD
ncbi:methionine/alanine import family NSS transporter small subunit [Tsukamurella asaccharolytica]|uniref:Methionine/alanine import family NSS transporter small subunit n=1 Tax=Tsukamurella asaccharolytica TaxID=2592067 RepID=A0A5C5RAL7_9ACTN|nr:methionine/alanine import family NSS transporter small subunit [Tsukamurella asaccharolytica]TWS19868.1 methionine/alanine import family NSS transporter small subunit [Tsukamurella asaccharolytica]